MHDLKRWRNNALQSHPLRQYVVLPFARLADMWLRPRIEYLNDVVPQRWWEWRLIRGNRFVPPHTGC